MSTQPATCQRHPSPAELPASGSEERGGVGPHAPSPAWAPMQARGAEMMRVFEGCGGLASCDEVLSRLLAHTSQPVSLLARRIVAQEVVCFEWRGQRVLPMFQFDPADLSVRPEAAAVLAELRDVFDEWELAAWFAEPSRWLQGRIPAEALAADPQGVLAAARADRFIARF